jgi:hypothetical protein
MRKTLLLLLVYAALTAVMAAPYVTYGKLHNASYEGDARLIVWTLAWDNHAVLTRAPVFDSNVFYPAAQSLAYNEHLFGLSVFTLPVFALTGNPVLAYNLAWIASFLLNGLAAHGMLKRHTSDDLAALAGSLVYTFSFYKMLHAHGHLHLVWTWLVPISILCLERWFERPSVVRALLWAGVTLLQALTSWYLAVIVALVQAVVVASCLPRLRSRRDYGQTWQLAAAAAVAAAIIRPFALPYRVLESSPRTEVAGNSADLAGYLVPPENTWLGQLWLAHIGPGPRWIWGEQTVFLGWIALVLGAFGFVHLWRQRRWRPLIVAATFVALGFVLSLGPSMSKDGETWSPFGALASLPGLGAFRAPARFALLVLLGLSVMVTSGADWLLCRMQMRRGRVALTAILLLMLSEWYVVEFPGGKPQPFPVPRIYRSEVLRSARAIVSLPEYRGAPDWYRGADYLYFSTTHWRPIVNGFGRTEPAGHARAISHMKAFPGPNNAATMRRLGVDFVVYHAARQPSESASIIQEALRVGEYELVRRIDNDYLFRVLPAPQR